jgi:long-chain acyl-CoA synthetase
MVIPDKEQQKPWLKYYDPGIPESLAPFPPMTLIDFMKNSAKKYPRRSALMTSIRLPRIGRQNHRLSYRQLDRLSDAMACALIDLGVKKGTKVSMIMPNTTSYVIGFYAILKAGGVAAAINPTYPPKKIAEYLDYADSEVVIVLTNLYQTIKDIQSQTKVRHVIATNFKEYLAPAAKLAFTFAEEKKGGHYLKDVQEGDFWYQDLLKKFKGKKPDVVVEPDDLAMMQFTGGTTGVMKGALATHQALSNSCVIAETVTSIKFPDHYNAPSREKFRVIAALPMFHVYGLVVLLSQAMAGSWEVILVADARDVNNLVDIIHEYRPEVMLGVPVLWHHLNSHPRVQSGEVDFSCFVYTQTAAAPMHHSIKEEFEKHGGHNLVEGYGLSEVPTGNHTNQIYHEYRTGSVGIPLPDVDCRIVDIDTGTKELAPHEVGEVILNTPFLLHSYYKMPEETANLKRIFDGKEFVYTGDVGYVDEDGFLYLVDRKKDMAIIGGFNVYPNIVEQALKSHPAIEDAGVWGVPHPKVAGQEALQAWIVLKEGQKLKSGDVVKYCKDVLAPYEIPRRIKFVEELPYSQVGKLLRRELVNL